MSAKKKFPPQNAKQAKGSNAIKSDTSVLGLSAAVSEKLVPVQKSSVAVAVPQGLYRRIQINAEEKTFSKEDAQVASVMTNIFSNLEDLSEKITGEFRDFEGDIQQLNIALNRGQEKTFIVFKQTIPSAASGQGVKQQRLQVKEVKLKITNKNPDPRVISEKSEEIENLLVWLQANGNKPTRETLSAEEQSVINALLLFYFNLYQIDRYKLIIKPYFTTILSSLLAKGYSDSAIFLEAAKQKFPPGQQLSVNIPQSSDKLASLLASYINGFAVGIRKTPKTQDAYIMIMDEDILRFLVDITTGQILSNELGVMLSEKLFYIDIRGTELGSKNTNRMINILRGIKNLKFKMQRELLRRELLRRGGNGSPEQILNLSFELLAEKYTEDHRGPTSFDDYVDHGISEQNQDPKDKKFIELRIIKNYFALQEFGRQMREAFLGSPQEASAVPMSPSKEDYLHVSTILPEELNTAMAVTSSSEAVQPPQKAFSSPLKTPQKKSATSTSMAVASSSEAVQPPGRQFYSFLLVLFFEAFPNLAGIRGQLEGETQQAQNARERQDAQHRAIFSAFYDFLNGHDFKIKNLLYVVDIVLPGFFNPFERRLLENVSNYHEDEEAIYRFSGENRKVTFLVNDDMWEKQFTYYDNNNNLLNSPITDDMIRTCPTLELFELIPCATRVTSFNDFKVGKEVAGPQLNTLKRGIILSIKEYIEKTPCQSVIGSNQCVDHVMSRIFFRVTDAVTLVSMFDSGSPPLFAAKYLIGNNPEIDGTVGEDKMSLTISTGDGTFPDEYKNMPFSPTKELIKTFYIFLTGNIVPMYPDVLLLSDSEREILRRMPLEYQNWFDQWIYFLFLQLKTPSKNDLAIGKQRSFLVSLPNKYINQKPPILLADQMGNKGKGYIRLLEFFRSMQLLSDAVKPSFDVKKERQKIDKLPPDDRPKAQSDLAEKGDLIQQFKEDLNSFYKEFFAALFDAFGKALASKNDEVLYHDLNKLFEFISLFVDDGPKSMGDVVALNNIKQEINKKIYDRTIYCKKRRATGESSQESDTDLPGGSRRRKNKYYKTKRIKHGHKYKKLTKKRRVKKHKTKKYNRHKK